MRQQILTAIRVVGLLVLPLLLACLGQATIAAATEITIVKSGDVTYYNQAVEGFRAALPSDARVTEHLLPDNATAAKELGQSIRAAHPDLVLTVGLKASLTAKGEIPDIPVIFCLVLNPELHGLPAANMTGILLGVEPQAQLDQMKRLVPHARRIGVLYDPQRQQPTIAAAKQHAKSLGLQLIAAPVPDAKSTAESLRAFLPQIDVLWLLPDQAVIREETVPLLISATLDAKLPLFGFSSTFVKRGALAALVVDPLDIGQQAGRVAADLLRGTRTGVHRLFRPDRPNLVLNLNTAEFLGLRFSPDMVRTASQIFSGSGAFASHQEVPSMTP